MFVVADARDVDGLAQRLAPLLQGDHFAARLVELLEGGAEVREALAQVLHLLEQALALVERELALAVRRVELLVEPAGRRKRTRLLRRPSSVRRGAPTYQLNHFSHFCTSWKKLW